MADTKPPQEREANRDRLHDWVKACFAELLRVAGQRRTEQKRRSLERFDPPAVQRSEFDPPPGLDSEDDLRECRPGRRRIPNHDQLMERLNNEARLRLSLNRARASRSLYDLAQGRRR